MNRIPDAADRVAVENQMPTWACARSGMYWAYGKNVPIIPNLPNSQIPDLTAIPEDLQITWKSRRDANLPPDPYLLHWSDAGQLLLLIFATQLALEVLHQSSHWVCDGTFKYCPKKFYQMYSIHGFVHGEASPLLICLMGNKQQVCSLCYKIHWHYAQNSISGLL